MSLLRRLLPRSRNSPNPRFETRRRSYSGIDADDATNKSPRRTSTFFSHVSGSIRRSVHRERVENTTCTPVKAQTEFGGQRRPQRRSTLRLWRGAGSGSSVTKSGSSSLGPPTVPEPPVPQKRVPKPRLQVPNDAPVPMGTACFRGAERSRTMSDVTSDRVASESENESERRLDRVSADGLGPKSAMHIDCDIFPLSMKQMSIILGCDEDDRSGRTLGGVRWPSQGG